MGIPVLRIKTWGIKMGYKHVGCQEKTQTPKVWFHKWKYTNLKEYTLKDDILLPLQQIVLQRELFARLHLDK